MDAKIPGISIASLIANHQAHNYNYVKYGAICAEFVLMGFCLRYM
jgi:hypothetical protein